MADQDSSPIPDYRWTAVTTPAVSAQAGEPVFFRQRYWLHALLFLLTVYSTTLVGARLAHNFAHNLPAFDLESDWPAYGEIWASPSELTRGLPFSLTLLAILLAHEF